ncbi:hypothetical protein EJ02DRAFT_440033 [Clathrospora elynae]|uniref:HRQ family protein 2 n=1 Tax=Clathrospora elynae TaxID=706981 RepID=A0A6A5T5I6_9PLEO|nr:hypothetical protein EJ02DRAFT_440033 [Clathrospora elynae]
MMDKLNMIGTRPSWGLLLLLGLVIGWHEEDAYYNIEALRDFDVDEEEPHKHRPFKPKFHMTMALENTTLSNLIPMDKTYRARLHIRKQIIKRDRYQVLACNTKAVPAVLELYEWLMSTYLPRRFPSVYTLSGAGLRNHVNGTILPLWLSDAEEALQMLGENIDDEFLFLLRSDKPEDEGKYVMEAFINCFPSGFNTRAKLGLLLADIHGPVPGYKVKLERSMDRFFASLAVGKMVKRSNWSISTSGELFCLEGSHGTAEEMERQGERREEDIDLSKTVLRCERQTLHRLPRTGALTYQYPIQELRDEGSGEVLAEAIDGLGLGSVPGIAVYKKQVVWGDKVKAFLRGEIDA